jgi:arsenate reductase
MAEGLLRHDSGRKLDVFSAGTKPSYVRPEAIEAMRELGIDISEYRSKSVDEFTGQAFDVVVTVCDNAKETCPVFTGARRMIHRSFNDPAGVQGTEAQRLEAFRRVRDELRDWLRELEF